VAGPGQMRPWAEWFAPAHEGENEFFFIFVFELFSNAAASNQFLSN
jgi:hypothetical protein